MKKVLVTGANGQLGRKIKDNVGYKKDIEYIFTDIQELDVTNILDLDKFFQSNKIDVLINCAAYTNVEQAEVDSENTFKLNADTPSFIGSLSVKYNFKIIHISTDYVFDGKANTPYSEDSLTNPNSVYGKSKLEGENNLINKNEDCIIIRTSWLYSEYGKNFAKTILELSEQRDILKVVYDQVGTPTYAGDLASAIIYISEKWLNENIWIPGIYNYSNLGVCSWYDFAVKILELINKNIEILPVLSSDFPAKAQRPNYSVLNKSKIANKYNVKIPYWTDSCDIMLKKYMVK